MYAKVELSIGINIDSEYNYSRDPTHTRNFGGRNIQISFSIFKIKDSKDFLHAHN